MDRFAQMERIKRGDQDAFREIYTAYRMPVYRFALEKTNDAQKALDIVKYVFSTVYETLKKEPYYGDFTAWFQTLAELKLSEIQIMEAHRAQQERSKAKARKTNRGDGKLPESAPAEKTGRQAADEPPLPKAKAPAGAVIVQVLFIILRIALMGGLIWAILGMLDAMHVLSIPDWGYSWFNANLFELF